MNRPCTDDATLYLGDNGACYYGAHLGATARYTGRDLSGQAVVPVRPRDAAAALAAYNFIPACERCGREAPLDAEGRRVAMQMQALQEEQRLLRPTDPAWRAAAREIRALYASLDA